jgi:hypothetical protein
MWLCARLLQVKNEKYAFTVRKNGVRECVWLKTWRGKQTEGSIWMPSHAYGLSQVSAAPATCLLLNTP